MALPLPLGSGVRGGADGILRTVPRISSSFSSLPLWMKRNRWLDVGGSSFERMRCFRAMTEVSLGSGISRRRSGIEVVKRTVMWRGVELGGPGKEAICSG